MKRRTFIKNTSLTIGVFGISSSVISNSILSRVVSNENALAEVKKITSGHLIGHQFSIAIGDPFSRKGFSIIMEGNNEVSIDGEEQVLDYLGTENSYTFSWGFRKTFTKKTWILF